jgi:Tol biopolymer transport system component
MAGDLRRWPLRRILSLEPLPGGPSNGYGVFIRERLLGTVTSAMVSIDAEPPTNGGAPPDISNDGRYVVFQSAATNLVPNGADTQAYLFDSITKTTTLVSRGLGGLGVGSETSAISGNGRFVFITSSSADLVPGDTEDGPHAYVYDRVGGTIEKVDVKDGVEGNHAVGGRAAPSMSDDGRYVAFDSGATNLGADEICVDGGGNCQDIFIRDRGGFHLARLAALPQRRRGGELPAVRAARIICRRAVFESRRCLRD